MQMDRRRFLMAGAAVGAALAAGGSGSALAGCSREKAPGPPDYTLRIGQGLVELAPDRVVSTALYNGQFPGPLLRFKEGQPVTIDIHNDTDTPEQLHWHGQFVPVEVDGAAEEGTPYIPPHASRRIPFTPRPSGLRFYHTHAAPERDLAAGQYNGQAGPVYIEAAPILAPTTAKSSSPSKSSSPPSAAAETWRWISYPAATSQALSDAGESAMKASLANGMPHGYEVGYGSFTINGKMLGHGEPIRVKTRRARPLPHHQRQRHRDPQPRAPRPHLQSRRARRQSRPQSGDRARALARHRRTHLRHRRHEAPRRLDHGRPRRRRPPSRHGHRRRIRRHTAQSPLAQAAGFPLELRPLRSLAPPGRHTDETIDMTFETKRADEGFDRWTINGIAFSWRSPRPYSTSPRAALSSPMRNASDDIHPIHLHRHSFELTKFAGRPTAGVIKDVVMVGGYQQMRSTSPPTTPASASSIATRPCTWTTASWHC